MKFIQIRKKHKQFLFTSCFGLLGLCLSATACQSFPQNHLITFNQSTNNYQYLQYLQRYWAWNNKLQTLASPAYGNNLTALSNKYSPLSFMKQDYLFTNNGTTITPKQIQKNKYFNFLQNYGFNIGAAVSDHEVPNPNNDDNDGPDVFYFDYPLLNIYQANMVDNDFVFQSTSLISAATQEAKLLILDSSNKINPKFRYLIDFQLPDKVSPTADNTIITITKYRGGTEQIDQIAKISYDSVRSQQILTGHTLYLPKKASNRQTPIQMDGAWFDVQVQTNTAVQNLLKLTPPVYANTYFATQTMGYIQKNMFAFLTTTQTKLTSTFKINPEFTKTKASLLAVDTSNLLSTNPDRTKPTTLNPLALKIIDNFDYQPTTTSELSDGAIVGITIGCLFGALFICTGFYFGVKAFRRHRQQKTKA